MVGNAKLQLPAGAFLQATAAGEAALVSEAIVAAKEHPNLTPSASRNKSTGLWEVGFFAGNLISTRIGNRISTEAMVLIGSVLSITTVVGQALLLSSGWVTPLAFFLPGFFITIAQGIAMPYGQVGAMAEVPRFAGTAAGIGVFMQNLCAAVFSQLYGFFADGSPRPMIMIAMLCGCLTLIVGAIPLLQKRLGTVPPPG